MNETNHPVRRLRHGDRPTEPLTFEDAAANKAAEEGGLPAIKTWRERAYEELRDHWLNFNHDSFMKAEIEELRERVRTVADRVSRQVANKAEVEPSQFKRLPEDRVREIAMDHLHDDTESAARNGFFTFSAEGLDGFAIELMDALATPPATTGASTARDAILDEAARAVHQCYTSLGGPPDDPHPEAVAHNGAVSDCVHAVRALMGKQSVGASTVDELQERSLKEIMADAGRRRAATSAVFDMLEGDGK